ncbi:hypothetical protein BC828DRAFT_387816 [Blastocladiella britannica]|nr:hypothetical protein BC828DRAFT_387816 [Blastocladiella britannica]
MAASASNPRALPALFARSSTRPRLTTVASARRHLHRSRPAGNIGSGTSLASSGKAAATNESVLQLIHDISASLQAGPSGMGHGHQQPENVNNNIKHDPFATFTGSSSAAVSFTPMPSGQMRAQGLSKLASVSSSSMDRTPWNRTSSTPPPASLFATPPQQQATPTTSATVMSTTTTTTDDDVTTSLTDDWDALLADMEKLSATNAASAAASGNAEDGELMPLQTSVAARRSAAARDAVPSTQAPDFSALAAQLAAATSTHASEVAMRSRRSSIATAMTATVSRDDLVALRVQLAAAARSPVHLRSYVATVLAQLPSPPAPLLADMVAAAGALGCPALAYAAVAEVRARAGLVGLVQAADPRVYLELARVAWRRERSMPRVVRWLRDMHGLGHTPNRDMRAWLLTDLLARHPAAAEIRATAAAATANALAVATMLPSLVASTTAAAESAVPSDAPSLAEAEMLWKVLCELNWTRHLAMAPLLAVGASRPTAARATAAALPAFDRDAAVGSDSPLLSAGSLADLVRSSGLLSDNNSSSAHFTPTPKY